mgnify:CR=1 FL=1
MSGVTMIKNVQAVKLAELDWHIQKSKNIFRGVYMDLRGFMEDGSATDHQRMETAVTNILRLFTEIKILERLRQNVVSLMVETNE